MAREPTQITEKVIDEFVQLYARGTGESLVKIAAAYGLTVAAVRFHLKQRGEYGTAPEAAQPEADSDEALGIGEDDEAQAASLDALMNNPQFDKLLEAAVSAKLKAMGHEAAPAAPLSGSERAFDAFLSKFDHMLNLQAEQQPGYKKPLSASEMDARAEGKRDMFALLHKCKTENLWPHYLLNDESNPFYGNSPNGPILYLAGQEIKMRGPPSESFKPLNDVAMQIVEAYRRWVGDPVSIEELTAQAVADARGASQVPEIDVAARAMESDVQLVDAPLRDVSPKRVLGTIAPEARGRSMPGQPGIVAQPSGPTFVDA